MNASNESKSKRERLNFLRECVRDIKRERDRERVTVKTKSVCVERERESLREVEEQLGVCSKLRRKESVRERVGCLRERKREREEGERK